MKPDIKAIAKALRPHLRVKAEGIVVAGEAYVTFATPFLAVVLEKDDARRLFMELKLLWNGDGRYFNNRKEGPVGPKKISDSVAEVMEKATMEAVDTYMVSFWGDRFLRVLLIDGKVSAYNHELFSIVEKTGGTIFGRGGTRPIAARGSGYSAVLAPIVTSPEYEEHLMKTASAMVEALTKEEEEEQWVDGGGGTECT